MKFVGRQWFAAGLLAILALFGLAAVIQAISRSQNPSASPPLFGFSWVWGFFGFFIFIWLIGWMFGFPWWYRRGIYDRRWPWEREEPVEILRVRYAKGELTKEQFEEMRRDLERQS